MKTKVLIVVALVLTSFFSFAESKNIAGNSNTSFGSYQLVPAEQAVVINNIAYKAWTLSYPSLEKRFTVLYSPGINGQCCFTIRNNDFEIQYVNVDGKFGVKLVEQANQTVKRKEVLRQIDRNQLEMQSILTSLPKTEEEYLGLIACFLPLLFA